MREGQKKDGRRLEGREGKGGKGWEGRGRDGRERRGVDLIAIFANDFRQVKRECINGEGQQEVPERRGKEDGNWRELRE